MSAYQPLILLALCLVPLWVAAAMVNQPVGRARVERFAQRHRLVVTVANGQRVVDYLATTRRWRVTGLATGLAATVAWLLPQQRIGVRVVFLLAGWFVGALIAELRVAQLTARRSAAVLVRRSADRYLPSAAVWTPATAAAACLALTLAVGLGAPAGRVRWEQASSLLAAALAVTALVWAVQRRVLTRAQPLAPPDLMQADNAIRSRSLHVLAGSGAALVLYCLLALAAQVAVGFPHLAGIVTVTQVVGGFAVPLLGWRIATSPWPVTDSPGTTPAPTPAAIPAPAPGAASR